jgi:crotonobetainyl-CoA:carnitine CoA-transferase CaiB-like acyl-CoA transferase
VNRPAGAKTDGASDGGPLAGIRVLDLTRVLAGPFCTMILADLGAEVIKVEGPDRPDYTRSIPPFIGEMSHYFLSINRNKKSISIDLKSDAGRALALDLASHSDIVVENFRPGVIDRLGLGYEALRRRRPDIIVCSLTGYGQEGPLAGKASVDTVVQALSGAMSVNGEADGPPVKLGLPLGDLAGSMWAAIGILAALNRRHTSGLGDHVDVGLLDGLIGMLSYISALYLATGESPQRVGSSHHLVPAYGRYPVQDGHLVLAAQMDPFWGKFCEVAGRPELGADPRFRTARDRAGRHAEVEALVAEILLTKSLAEWDDLLDAADVPHAPVLSVGEALEQPYARERGLIQSIEQPGIGAVRVQGPTIKFHFGDDRPSLGHAPALGEHTRSILSDVLGLPASEIAQLLGTGVVSEGSQAGVASPAEAGA